MTVTTWTTAAVLDWTTKKLGEAGVGAARLEAQVLLAHALGCTRVQLYTGFDRPLSEGERTAARELIRRRLGGEPLAYLVGEQEFWSLPFTVDPSVLIPRHDTETVVSVVLDRVGERAAERTVLDLCTGAGPLAIALAKELKGARVLATDVSPAAVAIARKNAERNQVADRIEIVQGDLWAAVGDRVFDVVVSNPPYIAAGEIAGLDREVQREPRLALDGGADGLAVFRRLIAALPAHVAAGGLVAFEHGHDQDAAVRALVDATGAFAPAATERDLAKLPRVTWARRH